MNNNWLDIITKNLTLLVFIAFLGVLYIANVHEAERKMMKIERLKKEVQTVKYRYMDVKQSIHYTSMPSMIEKKVIEKGLRQSDKAPTVLKLNKS